MFPLREAFPLFIQDNPGIKISFSKFCELKLEWVKLASQKQTHVVCVCIKHQNPKLKLEGAGIKEGYRHCIALSVCSMDSETCMMGQCGDCPGDEILIEFLNQKLQNDETVSYSQWTTVDRTNLVTMEQQVGDFIEDLVEDVMELKYHHFVAKKQAEFYRYLKDNLKEGECLITCDFAQNYTSTIQDEVQSAFFDKHQITVFTVVTYHRDQNLAVIPTSYGVISPDLKHDAAATNIFLENIVAKVKAVVPGVEKVYLFSDGGPGHFKNKSNFANISMFEFDFNIAIEWHFWATRHGKNCGDVVGGTIKREAKRASLRGVRILSACDLFDWCQENLKKHNISSHSRKPSHSSKRTVEGTI